MKRLILLTALLALVIIPSLAAQSTLRRVYQDLDIDVWTDRDDGSNYYEGDEITIYFRASEDCYVTVYDLDSRGNVNLLFPPERGDNHFVRGGEIYMIPERDDDYTLTLEGPPGYEHIQMVASPEFFPVPDWRGPVSVYEKEWGFKYDGDNDQFIEQINQKYFGGASIAYDYASFYVAPKYYYQPERADCSGDCGKVYIDYPNGCEVYVDGVFFGFAPLYVPGIYVGRHRVTVYWSSSIVYNDWIFVDPFAPFFVYTRPHYIYNYCYDHWYHDYVWGSYYDGPSRYKYKSGDFYSNAKPKARRGYEVVANDHAKYTKSKSYVTEKETRISKYKATYGYDAKAKSFQTTKYRAPDEQGAKKYYNAEGKQGKAGVKEYYEKKRSEDKSSGGKVDQSGRQGKKSYDGAKAGNRESSGDVKKRSDSQPEKKAGTYVPADKPKSGDSGSKPSAPEVKPKSSDSGGKSSSGSTPKQSDKPSGGKKGKN